MTTVVTVKANHGWPVRVQQWQPHKGNDTVEMINETIVAAGEERDFVCHSHADLNIHEIQPGE